MGMNPSECTYGCGDNLPVHNVVWHDAVAYLNKLTALESKVLVALGEAMLTTCYEGSGEDVVWVEGCTGYRLPTEAEWEYAARAGTTTRWSFGDVKTRIGEYAWFKGNAEGKVRAVGGLKANAWGLYDMHGNVWEWVWDVYGTYQSDKVVNSEGTGHALRGGSFVLSPWGVRSANRSRLSPRNWYMMPGNWDVGFRCARGPGPLR